MLFVECVYHVCASSSERWREQDIVLSSHRIQDRKQILFSLPPTVSGSTRTQVNDCTGRHSSGPPITPGRTRVPLLSLHLFLLYLHQPVDWVQLRNRNISVTVCVSKPRLDALILIMSRILYFLNGAGANRRGIRSRSSLHYKLQTNMQRKPEGDGLILILIL